MLKDKEARKEAAKLRKRKQRMSHPEPVASKENVTPGEMSHLGPVTPDITLNNVTPDVTPQVCQEKGCFPKTMHCAPRCYLLKWTLLPDPGEGWGGLASERGVTGTAWGYIHGYLQREPLGLNSMSNLERLQRIAGSLGKHAGEVRFGLSGPTFQEIGEVIGVQPAMLTK